MKLSAAEIEEVVREVLLRIGASPQTKTVENENKTLLEIGDRVVATTHLLEIAEHATVRIPASSIVTPAARDLAAERQIHLERASKIDLATSPRWIHEVGHFADKVTQLAAEEFKTAAPQKSVTTELAIKNLVVQLRDRKRGRGVLLTPDVDYAICLSNRSSSVRAIGWDQPVRLKRAMADLAANLLVVDPRQTATSALLGGIRLFFSASQFDPPSPLNQNSPGII